MGKVVNIEESLPHEVSEVICCRCCRRWIAVRPAGTLLKDIVCPDCGPGAVINTGQALEEAAYE